MNRIATTEELTAFILELLFSKTPMDGVLDYLCERTGIHAMVLDEQAQLLCGTEKEPYQCAVWTRIVENKRIPYSFTMEQPRFLYELWVAAHKRAPVQFELPHRDCLYTLYPLIVEYSLAGHVLAVADRGVNPEFILEAARTIGSVYLHKYPRAETPGRSTNSFFLTAMAWELLASDAAWENTQLLARQDAYQLNLRIPDLQPPFLIAAVRGEGSRHGVNGLNQLGERLKEKMPNQFYLADKDILLVLFSKADQQFCALLESDFKALLRRENLRCGLSAAFDDLNLRKAYKEQALSALRLGRSQAMANRLFYAEQLYPALLFRAAAKRLGVRALRCESLELLAEHDRLNGTEYLDTLKRYLVCGCNRTQTSAALYIDRSTLKYRLAKIEALTGKKLDDPMDSNPLLLLLKCSDFE